MFDHKVTQFARKKNKKGQMTNQIVSHRPYKAVVMGKPPRKFFLREGKIVDAQNRPVDPKDLPADVANTFKTMTPEGQKSYGVPK